MRKQISTRPLRRIMRLVGLVTIAVSLLLPNLASADPAPTTVRISQSAQFISSFQINVEITLSCSAGSGYFASVNVEQPQGFGSTTFGNGFTSGQCTGRQQKLAVPVYSFFEGWQLGDAVASATACTAACASDTKQIHIVP